MVQQIHALWYKARQQGDGEFRRVPLEPLRDVDEVSAATDVADLLRTWSVHLLSAWSALPPDARQAEMRRLARILQTLDFVKSARASRGTEKALCGGWQHDAEKLIHIMGP